MHRSRIILWLACVAAGLSIEAGSRAQVQLPQGVPRGITRPPSVNDLLSRAPLTSTLDDAVNDVPLLDRFDPQSGAPLMELPLGFTEGVTLVPGLWEATVRSYCLQPGTYGPTRGDGYLWAPLKGAKADVVAAILHNSARHPEIAQEDVQVLLWGVLARTKVSDMNTGARQAAGALLTGEQVASIDGSALDLIPGDWLDRVIGPLGVHVRRALEAENKVREAFANPGDVAYDELERIAVLDGVPERQGRDVADGRWSWHPDGYFIRFLPNQYSSMRIQIYSPEAFSFVRDSAGKLTAIEGPGGARVALSSRAAAPAPATALSSLRFVPAARRSSAAARDLLDLIAELARDTRPASGREQARYLSASLGGLLPHPSPAPVPYFAGQRYGGRGGGSGGGGGAGLGGGGRQRIAPTPAKNDGDDALDRAREATNWLDNITDALSPLDWWGSLVRDTVFENILGRNFDAWRQASDALKGDPPRQDFREFTRPRQVTPPVLQSAAGRTSAQTDRFNALAADLLLANAYLSAAIVSLDRHGGAVQAGDRAWATKQAHALTYLKREAGLISQRVAAHLEAFAEEAANARASAKGVRPAAALKAAAERIRAVGAHFASLPDIGPPW